MPTSERSQSTLHVLLSTYLTIGIYLSVLPLATLLLAYNYAALILVPQNALRHRLRQSAHFSPQTVVVTGISTPAGLRIARAFYQLGHNVIGVQDGGLRIFDHAGWSRALSKLYRITPHTHRQGPGPYITDLLDVIEKEKAALWVDCSPSEQVESQAKARRIIEIKTNCVCIAAEVDHLTSYQGRRELLDYAKSLELPTPETLSVESRGEIYDVLNDSRSRKYKLTEVNGGGPQTRPTILPKRTVSQTYHDVSQIKISKLAPWALEQNFDDLPKYVTTSIVVRGSVRAFAVGSMHAHDARCELIPSSSGLHQAMLRYVQEMATQSGESLSSHLTVTFGVDEKATKAGVVQQIMPVEASLTASPVLQFFDGEDGSIELTKVYSALLPPVMNGTASRAERRVTSNTSRQVVEPLQAEAGLYSLEKNVHELLIEPLAQLLMLRSGVREVVQSSTKLVNCLVFNKEVTWELWDPLPLFWLLYLESPLRTFLGLPQALRWRREVR